MQKATDEKVKLTADEYARANKKQLASTLTHVATYPPDTTPVAVFMAGSPGAGKTEASQRLIEKFSPVENQVIRIDSDELRLLLPGYDGTNSSLFQAATSIIADKMQDLAIKQSQSYVFDGTLSNLKRARENIDRCLNRHYSVHIIYVYQDPVQAWEFVQARSMRDGRVVPKESFIKQYFEARLNVNQLKKDFGKQIELHIIVKNIDGTDFQFVDNVGEVDDYAPESYTHDKLQQIII